MKKSSKNNILKSEALLNMMEDLEEAKRNIEESEKRYRSLFQNMIDGFAYCKMIFDRNNKPIDFVYLEINNAFEKLTGLKRKNVLGKRVTKFIPGIKSAHPELFKIYGNVALNGKPTRFEIYFEPLKIWLNIGVYCPQKEYFVAVFENISERKKAEKKLHESEAKYKAIVENVTDYIFMIDKNNKVLSINKAGARSLGKKPKDLIGKSIFNLFPKNIATGYSKNLKKVFKTGKPFYSETKMIVKGKTSWIRTSLSPVKNHKGKTSTVIGISTDITKQRK